MDKVMRVGIIGLGGFAGWHHNSVQRLEAEGQCKLVCTCDPVPDNFKKEMSDWEFEKRGVQVFTDYITMLDKCQKDLDMVVIPTPVPLHAEMHKTCVERGIPIWLEKPPTVDYAQLDEMLAVEKRAVKATRVGFNFIADPVRQEIKKRIMSGEFGPIKKVCCHGLSERYVSYYRRAPWAGRLMMGDQLILDSCMSNAMGHSVFNTLFWAGQKDLLSWAEITSVDAELYRAHDIEGVDTVFLKASTKEGIPIELAMSHTGAGGHDIYESVVCENAVIKYILYPVDKREYQIHWNDGRVEKGKNGEPSNELQLDLRLAAYFDYLRGKVDRPLIRLIDSKPFVHICDLVYIAAKKITTVAPEYLEIIDVPAESTTAVGVDKIEAVVDEFFKSGRFPSQQGVAWGRPGGSATTADLPKLRETVLAMVQERKYSC